ncbi:hypothetical protein V5279_26745 [Bradyrhizobium sp. 26S5]|uniref:hypothetical protein n=1 Tax=Bradyrhizobium sp. 26S5 TaxID=3139729 RepID=UPI0030CDCB62
MTSIDECRARAAEFKIRGSEPHISARRSTVLLSISRSWTALAHQFENLAVIVKDEQ